MHIRNFAIIDELKIRFSPGLNVLSGETGAGKSIIVGAVSLLLGDRASSDQIRTSEDSAVVDALFDISDNDRLKESLRSRGFDAGEELLIKRVVSRSGKNRIYINGSLANLNMLSSLSESLVNICGQHEHQVLLNPDNHLDILDEFGGLTPLSTEFAGLFREYSSLKADLENLKSSAEQRIQTEEFLKFQLREIEEARISVGEDVSLAEERKIIQSSGKLKEYAEGAYETLYGGEGSVLASLSRVVRDIREIQKIDPSLKISPQELDSVLFGLEEAALALRDYFEKVSFDPARLDEIEERLEYLGRLKRKYGGTLDRVLEKREEIRRELEKIFHNDEEIARVEGVLRVLEESLREKAEVLSGRRKEEARVLKEKIEQEIHDLKMERARFEILFVEPAEGQAATPVFNPRGKDTVEFYLATNIGEDLKPLNRIASGGELSRIVLAMKKVLAGVGSVGTIVFDEVDSGIGGATAEIVGEKLRDVSRSHQVICITHLPQIASFGESHYVVSKDVSGRRTNTRVRLLSASDRLDEIARMLGGVEITDKTKAHAAEMLGRARDERQKAKS